MTDPKQHLQSDAEVIDAVAGSMGFAGRRGSQRRSPSRCLKCGKVSKAVVCGSCHVDRVTGKGGFRVD